MGIKVRLRADLVLGLAVSLGLTSCIADKTNAPPAAQFCTEKPVFEPLPFLMHRIHFNWFGYHSEAEMLAGRKLTGLEVTNEHSWYEPVDRTLFPDAPPYARMLRASPRYLEPSDMVNVALQGGYAYAALPPLVDEGSQLPESIVPARPKGREGEWVLRVSRPSDTNPDCGVQDVYIKALQLVLSPEEEKRKEELRGNLFLNKVRWIGLGASYERSLAVLQEQRAALKCLKAEWIPWESVPLKAYRLSWLDRNVARGAEYGHSPRYVFFDGRLIFFDAAVIRGKAGHESTKGDPYFDSCCISGPPFNGCSFHGEDDILGAMGNDYDYLLKSGE